MRPIAAIALCAAGTLLVQAAFSVDAQIIKTKDVTKEAVAIDTDALLNSSAGCSRHASTYADIAQELTSVTANAACPNYVRLRHACPPNRVWIHKYTLPLATPLWAGYAPPSFSVSQQNAMIANARTQAAAIPAPAGTALYRLTYSIATVGNGHHPTQRVLGHAHFGFCGSGHP